MPDEPKHIDTGGGAYVGAGVKVPGGDFVGRDKVVTATQDATLEEFRSLLAELRRSLPQAGLDSDAVQVIDADFQVVEEQAAKPSPNGAIVKSKLKSIKEVLDGMGGAAGNVDKLLMLLGKAVQWAGVLF